MRGRVAKEGVVNRKCASHRPKMETKYCSKMAEKGVHMHYTRPDNL